MGRGAVRAASRPHCHPHPRPTSPPLLNHLCPSASQVLHRRGANCCQRHAPAGVAGARRPVGVGARVPAMGLAPAGLRHPRMPTGHLMSVQSVCLRWHWQPYGYSRAADDTDGAPVQPLPPEIVDLAQAAVGAAYGPTGAEAAGFTPDAAIVNLYAPGARLGVHQDGEEPSDAPVVTTSLGHMHLAARRRRPPDGTRSSTSSYAAGSAGLRWFQPPHLPPGAQGAPGDAAGGPPPGRAPEHHGPGARLAVSASTRIADRVSRLRWPDIGDRLDGPRGGADRPAADRDRVSVPDGPLRR